MKLTRGQLLDLLLEIEDRLRILVRAVFSNHRSDWVNLIPKPIRNELSDDLDVGGTEILARASLKQLIDTLLSRWKLFQPILDDKAWIQSRLEELRKARNDLAHGRKPDSDQKVAIALLASQLGERIPTLTEPAPTAPAPEPSGSPGLHGRRILWVDDRPEGNRWARRLLSGFGADVVPVLDNEEAVHEATAGRFDVAISDIDRGAGEPGTLLGIRLKAAGAEIPIVFYVAELDASLPLPVGAVTVTNDVTAMLTRVLSILRPDAVTR